MNKTINDMAQKAKTAGSAAAAKAKDLSETVQLKGEISSNTQKKDQLLFQLGSILYKKEKSKAASERNPAYANMVDAIASFDYVIELKQQALQAIQNGSSAGTDGSESVSSAETPKIPGDNEMLCPSCGKIIPKEKHFCLYCGCDLTAR